MYILFKNNELIIYMASHLSYYIALISKLKHIYSKMFCFTILIKSMLKLTLPNIYFPTMCLHFYYITERKFSYQLIRKNLITLLLLIFS